jgi:hypothetical protein
VKFNTIDHATDPGNFTQPCGYNNFTMVSTEVEPGQTYTISVSFYSVDYIEYVRVWIDWDRSYTLDSDEVYNIGQGTNTTLSADILVPPDAVPGHARMRVFMKYEALPDDPCGTGGNGEVEDYTVIVLEGLCGDLDNDGDVDYDDYVIFRAAFGGPVDGTPPQDAQCDFDSSGAVGMTDYAAWLDCYRDYVGDPQAGPPSNPLVRPKPVQFDGRAIDRTQPVPTKPAVEPTVQSLDQSRGESPQQSASQKGALQLRN